MTHPTARIPPASAEAVSGKSPGKQAQVQSPHAEHNLERGRVCTGFDHCPGLGICDRQTWYMMQRIVLLAGVRGCIAFACPARHTTTTRKWMQQAPLLQVLASH